MKSDFQKNGNSWRDNKENSKYPWHHQETVPNTNENTKLALGLILRVAIQVLFTKF